MFHQHYLDAIETVLAWDLPEEAIADAIHHQVMQSTDVEADSILDNYSRAAHMTNHAFRFATCAGDLND